MPTPQASSAAFSRNWRDLIRPKLLEVDRTTLTGTYGRFSCEPLERGFGTTIGNSLRRVLLSSLQGAAVTAIRIDGALHGIRNFIGIHDDQSIHIPSSTT